MTTTDVAIRQHGTDLVPDGYQPIVARPPQERLPSTAEFDMMMRIAAMAVEGANKADGPNRALPIGIRTPEQAMTIMLAGYELGFPPLTALRRLYIVNGRVELETQALMGLVKAGDPTAHFRFTEYSRDAVEVELYRQGELIIAVSYTRQDAEAAGQLKDVWYRKKDRETNQAITVDANYVYRGNERRGAQVGNSGKFYVLEQGKSVWVQFTRDMLAYSAVKRCCRLGAPELTNQVTLPPPAPEGPYLITAEARARGDEIAAPINPVSAALTEGTATPQEVFGGEASTEPEPQQPPEAPNHPPARRQTAPRPRQAAPEASAAPHPAAKPDPRLLQRITDRLTLFNKGNEVQSPIDRVAYHNLYARIRDEHMGGAFDMANLTAQGAAAVWEMVKPEEPPAPDTQPPAPDEGEPDYQDQQAEQQRENLGDEPEPEDEAPEEADGAPEDEPVS